MTKRKISLYNNNNNNNNISSAGRISVTTEDTVAQFSFIAIILLRKWLHHWKEMWNPLWHRHRQTERPTNLPTDRQTTPMLFPMFQLLVWLTLLCHDGRMRLINRVGDIHFFSSSSFGCCYFPLLSLTFHSCLNCLIPFRNLFFSSLHYTTLPNVWPFLNIYILLSCSLEQFSTHLYTHTHTHIYTYIYTHFHRNGSLLINLRISLSSSSSSPSNIIIWVQMWFCVWTGARRMILIVNVCIAHTHTQPTV